MGEDPREIERQIEHTREHMGETVEALAYKADVPSRVKESLTDKKDAVVEKLAEPSRRSPEARETPRHAPGKWPVRPDRAPSVRLGWRSKTRSAWRSAGSQPGLSSVHCSPPRGRKRNASGR